MKKLLISIFSLLLFNNLYSQNININDKVDSIRRFDVSVYGGISNFYSDVKVNVKTKPLYGVNLGYFVHNSVSANIDIAFGNYEGGDRNNVNTHYMEFTNKYTTIGLHGQFYPFRLIPGEPTRDALYYLSGFYIGAGLGFHINRVDAFLSPIEEVGRVKETNYSDFYVPLTFGWNVPLYELKKSVTSISDYEAKSKRLYLSLRGRYNFATTDTWDGYNPTVIENKHNDASLNFMIGVGMNF